MSGGSIFFTVNLLERRGNDLLTRHIGQLREAVRLARRSRPLTIDAWVVLPDHLHCVWTLPPGDDDFSTRWRVIKTIFARSLPNGERRFDARLRHRERGIWQRRFWEHTIRDDAYFAAYDMIMSISARSSTACPGTLRSHSTFKSCVRRACIRRAGSDQMNRRFRTTIGENDASGGSRCALDAPYFC